MWKVWLTQRFPPQMTALPSKPAPALASPNPPLSKGFQLPPAGGSSAAVSTAPFQAMQTVSMKGKMAVGTGWKVCLPVVPIWAACQYLSIENNVCDRVIL